MATRTEAEQEYKKYFKDKPFTEMDYQNYQKHGSDVFKRSYEKITGQIQTPSQAGQKASEGVKTDTQSKIDDITNRRKDLTSQGSVFTDILKDALQKKQQKLQPITEEKSNLRQELLNASDIRKKDKDFQGLSPDAKLDDVMANVNRVRTRMGELDDLRSEANAEMSDVVESARGMMQDQLNLYGLELEDLGLQKADEQRAEDRILNLAFDNATLLAGVVPESFSTMFPDLVPTWEAQSTELRRQQALSERPSGGGGGGRSKSKDTVLSKFEAMGGSRIQKADGGFDFFYNGQPINVETAASMVEGATPADFLRGSITSQDVGTIQQEEYGVETEDSIQASANELQTYIDSGTASYEEIYQDPGIPDSVKAKIKP